MLGGSHCLKTLQYLSEREGVCNACSCVSQKQEQFLHNANCFSLSQAMTHSKKEGCSFVQKFYISKIVQSLSTLCSNIYLLQKNDNLWKVTLQLKMEIFCMQVYIMK
jgi:hypothetical protein